MPDFDCIVIGAGIGGLIAAGRLTASGRKVLVLEKNSTPGGYLQSFKRRSVTFDSSVDCYSGLDVYGPITLVLSALGVDNEVERIRVDPIRTSIFPSLTVNVHADIGRYLEDLKNLFPSEKTGIDALFSTLNDIYSDIKGWGDFVTGLSTTERIPASVISHSRMTYKGLLDSHIKDERLKAVLSDRCSFYGLPPEQAGAVAMAALVMSYFSSGAWRVKGGSQRLADALVKGIRAKGSTVLFKKKAEKILTKGNHVVGVKTSDGDEFTASSVISAIDFNTTFNKLLDNGKGSEALKQKVTGESSSFFILYAGVKMDLTRLGNSSSIGYYPSFDIGYNFTREACFDDKGSIGITIPTLSDDSMAPAGVHSITAHEMAEMDFADWKDKKDELTEKVLDKVEKVIPGIRQNAVHIEAATPATLERYTANTKGAAYGWVQSPGLRPLKTFIDGLYLAGHWEGTGGGVVAAAYSGHKAARLIEDKG